MFLAVLAAACGDERATPDVASDVRLAISEAIDGPRQLATPLMVEGLVTLREDGRAEPRLAESWAWEADQRRLRVRLRPNVKLHDGTPLTAAMVADVLTTEVARPENGNSFWTFQDIAAVRADGEREVVIDLRRSAGALPEDLVISLRFGDQATGPYRAVKIDPGEVILERFPDYYRGRPAIRRVTFTRFPTLRTAWAGLLRGDVDALTAVTPDAVEFVASDDVRITSFLRSYQFMVAFNNARAPFRSAAVRRALNLAIDRDKIVAAMLNGRGLPAAGTVWPRHWAYDASGPAFTYDPRAAEALLDAAGLPRRRSTGPGPNDVRFSFACMIPANFRGTERIALEVQRQLLAIGVDMQFENVGDDYAPRVTASRFDSVFIDLIMGPSLGRIASPWRSARQFRGLNVFGYENAEAEALFETLHSTTDEAVIRSATRRVQRVLYDDPPALHIAWSERLRAISRRFDIPSEDREVLTQIWQWTPRAVPSVPPVRP